MRKCNYCSVNDICYAYNKDGACNDYAQGLADAHDKYIDILDELLEKQASKGTEELTKKIDDISDLVEDIAYQIHAGEVDPFCESDSEELAF